MQSQIKSKGSKYYSWVLRSFIFLSFKDKIIILYQLVINMLSAVFLPFPTIASLFF